MSDNNLPVVGDGVPIVAVEAAEEYVRGHINSGYEEDFFILDSRLTHISVSEEDDHGQMVDLEYGYYSINTEDLKNQNFANHHFQSERIRFYLSDLIEGAETGALSPHIMASELTPMDFGSVEHQHLIAKYEKTVDHSNFEDCLFELITDHLSEDVFSFSEVEDFDDVRPFFEAVSKTLDDLESGSFDVEAEDEWWSGLYELDRSELKMFERVIGWRVGNLRERIKSVEAEILNDQKFNLHNEGLEITFDGQKAKVYGDIDTPCVIVELINGRVTNKLRLGSAAHIADELNKNGSNVIPLEGTFAGKRASHAKLVTSASRFDAEKLVEATSKKIGVWLPDKMDAEMIIKKNYYAFDRFMYV